MASKRSRERDLVVAMITERLLHDRSKLARAGLWLWKSIQATRESVYLDDEPRIRFAETKSHRDRVMPIGKSLADALRRLQAQTLRDGEPLVGISKKLDDKRVLKKAKVDKLETQIG